MLTSADAVAGVSAVMADGNNQASSVVATVFREPSSASSC
jgi:hypothetical protein